MDARRSFSALAGSSPPGSAINNDHNLQNTVGCVDIGFVISNQLTCQIRCLKSRKVGGGNSNFSEWEGASDAPASSCLAASSLRSHPPPASGKGVIEAR